MTDFSIVYYLNVYDDYLSPIYCFISKPYFNLVMVAIIVTQLVQLELHGYNPHAIAIANKLQVYILRRFSYSLSIYYF